MIFCKLGLHQFDVLALLADDNARAGRVHRDAGILCRALDDDTADRSMRQLLLQNRANLDVLIEHRAKSLLEAIPARPQLRVTERRKPVG
jgi:hypothetical protein